MIAYAPENAALLKNLQVDIPFRFRNPTAADDGRLTEPRWTTTLSPAGADQLFPRAARAEKIWKGAGTVSCAASADGSLVDCRLVSETPPGKGFGEAALDAAKLMQMNLWTKRGDAIEGRRLTLPFRFEVPAPPEPPKAP